MLFHHPDTKELLHSNVLSLNRFPFCILSYFLLFVFFLKHKSLKQINQGRSPKSLVKLSKVKISWFMIYTFYGDNQWWWCAKSKNVQNVMNVFNDDVADAYWGGGSKLAQRFPPNQPDRRGGIFIILINEYGSWSTLELMSFESTHFPNRGGSMLSIFAFKQN